MKRIAWLFGACLVGVTLLLVVGLRAQQPQNSPHVGYVYPAGGQRGTTFQVNVGGRFLDGVVAGIVSGRGVEAKVVGHDKPLTGQQITDLREKLQDLQKQGSRAELAAQLADARLKIGDALRRNANPGLAEIVTLEVAIAPDADPGQRQLRLQTPLGVTNPLVFEVGQLPEFREKDLKMSRADTEMAITLPATVNGRMIPGDVDRMQFPMRRPPQYMPGDVDRYRFHATTGQDLVIAAHARDLMPYIADAVPGWFQAALTLYDANGREIACDAAYRVDPDPVLRCQVPADGDYLVEIRDALYRGRDDFTYRISIGQIPFITAIFPLGGRAGRRTGVEVSGWNLAAEPLFACLGGEPWRGRLAETGQCVAAPAKAGRLTVDARRRQEGVFPLAVRTRTLLSNAVPFALDTLPETFEREPNDSSAAAQRVSLPVIVNGRIGKPGDVDAFRFDGRSGEDVVAEVQGRRLGSPIDSVLELTDRIGRRVAFNDDHDDKAAGLVTHQADSYLAARLPATGTYYLRIADLQHHGGAEYAYRLRISAPRPDFELRVAPSQVNASGSASIPLTVYAIRKDGFDGDVELTLAEVRKSDFPTIGRPDSRTPYRLSGGLIPSGQDRVRVTLTVPPGATDEPVMVKLEGRATIRGRAVAHEAVPADEMMQAFAYEHLVPADALRVSISGRGATRVPAAVVSAQPVRIAAGGSARVRVMVPPAWLTFENVRFELSEPPDGITLTDFSIDALSSPVPPAASRLPSVQRGGPPGAQFVLRADAVKLKPGVRGNLIVTVSGERSGRGAQPGAPAVRRRIPMGVLPAIAFEVVSDR